jgi:hypothetical protein
LLTAGPGSSSVATPKQPEAPPINTDIKFNLDPNATPPVASKTEDTKPLTPPSGGLPALTPPKADSPPALASSETKTGPAKVDDKKDTNTTTRQSFPNETGSPATAKSDTGSTPAGPPAMAAPPTAPLFTGDLPKVKEDKPLAGTSGSDAKPGTETKGAIETKPNTPAPPALGNSTPSGMPPSPPLFTGNGAPALGTNTPPVEKKDEPKVANPTLPTAPGFGLDDPSKKAVDPRVEPKVPGNDATAPGTAPQVLPNPPDLNGNNKAAPATVDLKPTPPNASPAVDANTASPLNTPPPAPNAATTDPSIANNTDTASRVTPDGRYREYLAPKATLGRPVPESVSAEQERRWAETAGAPSPIVPSSADVRGTPTRGTPRAAASTIANTERRVVSDSYLPRERAVTGETFSSLSQRLYGDTSYAAALAAFNRDEGIVVNDQPTPNEWVAKPNREILDMKYPHLIRPAPRPNLARNPNSSPRPAASNPAPAAASASDLVTYRVAKGEQLFDVAKKTLGDGYRWSEIYALNKDMLRDSTELRADMMLKLPGDAKVDVPKAR